MSQQNTDSKQKFSRADNVPKMILKQINSLDMDNGNLYYKGQLVSYVNFIARIEILKPSDTRLDIQFNDDTGLLITNVFKNGTEYPQFIKNIGDDDVQSQYYNVLIFVRVFKNNSMFVVQNMTPANDYNQLSAFLLNVMRIEKNPQRLESTQQIQGNQLSQNQDRYAIQEEQDNSNVLQQKIIDYIRLNTQEHNKEVKEKAVLIAMSNLRFEIANIKKILADMKANGDILENEDNIQLML